MGIAANSRWALASQFTRIAVQGLSLVVYARLLSPDQFGLAATVAIVVNFASFVRDLGLGAALVRERSVTEEMARAAFQLSAIVACTLALCMIPAAVLMSGQFHRDELRSLVPLASIGVLFGCLGSIPQARMEREFRFRELAHIEITSQLAGMGLGVLIAVLFNNAVAIVLQTVFASVLGTTQLIKSHPVSLEKRVQSGDIRRLLGFSGYFTIFNLLNYFCRNADAYMVGKAFGAAALGLYSLGIKLMMMPLLALTYVANRLLVPKLSSLDSLEMKTNAYEQSLSLIAFISAPAMLFGWVFRDVLIDVVLGPKWEGLDQILFWLLPTGFLQSITSTAGAVHIALGETRRLAVQGLISTFLFMAAFLYGATTTVAIFSACYFFVNLANGAIALYATCAILQAPAIRVIRAVGIPLIAAVLASQVAFALYHLFHVAGQVCALLIASALAGCIYVLASQRCSPQTVKAFGKVLAK